MSNVVTVTSSNIDELLKKEITMLQFSAEWCGPCKMITPIIEDLSAENNGKSNISIGKVDVDDNSEIARQYEIRGIPTILFFKDGEVVDKFVGFKSKPELQAKLNSLLS